MRTIEKDQVLTTGRVDYNGNQIPPDVIEWEDYDKNPVLLYDKKDEGHGGVVIGKVINRRRVGDGFIGNLSFMERNEDADIAYEKYVQGVLPFVSIGGFAVGEEREGVFVALRYRPREFSLIKFPANIDAKQVDASTLSPEDTIIFSEMSEEGKKEVRYLTMGCTFMKDEKQIDASEGTVTNDKDTVSNEPAADEETVNASEEQTTEEETVNASEEQTTEEETVNASEEPAANEETVNASEEQTTEEETVNASEEQTTEEETVNASEGNGTTTQNPLPDGMTWHEQNQSIKFNPMNVKEFRELRCDADFNRRLNALNAAYRSGQGKADNTPENAETIRVLACSMLADEKMVILANATNVTDGVTHQRSNALQMLVECAAGGAAAATLAAADLGVIKYLSLVYTQLLANDTFRRAVRFVPMSDRTGAIYIESGINPPTYVGNVTPINVNRYFYDDIKRTIARKVFTFAPITFQHADMAVLAYDKQSLGIGEAMDRTFQDISTYWLQVIANTAGIGLLGTSGEAVSTKGLFPIEAPLSNVQVLKPVLNDLIALEGHFLMQNYRLENKRVELVLPSNVYSMLAADPENRNQLTRELNANLGSYINFSATRVTPRNPVARFNTTTNKPELDAAMYADNTVADNGTATAITPATTTAAHIGAGVAFVENEVIAGVGAIELITMPDPMNYGTTISGWVSTGCTVARQNGVGAALLAPTVKPADPTPGS